MNQYVIDGNKCIGYTSKNEEFYFDKEDLPKVSKYTWYTDPRGYVKSNACVDGSRKQKTLYLHRVVMNENDPDVFIDHICGNKMDNRKSQLRRVNNAQNSQNHKRYKTNSTGVTGVYWNKNKHKWQASISADKKIKYLGLYDTKEAAITARKEAESQLYGDYAGE